MSSESITILIGGTAFMIIAFFYLMFCSKSVEEAIEEAEPGNENPVEETEVEVKKKGGKSFKKLK